MEKRRPKDEYRHQQNEISSRLIVKNLPHNMTEAKLRKTFGQRGHIISDVKLHHSQGAFRQFAFVGFVKTVDATEMKDLLDQTYVGTSKIRVEYCQGLHDASHGKSFKTHFDATTAVSSNYGPEIEETKPVNKPKPQMKEFPTIKVSNLPADRVKKRELKEFFRPIRLASIRIPSRLAGFAYVGFADLADRNAALKRHNNLLRGRQVQLRAYARAGNQSKEAANDVRWQSETAALESEETIGESGRLFVRNLCYEVTRDSIVKLFTPYGPLDEVSVPINAQTGKSTGFAFVTFLMPQHAVAAFNVLDGSIFMGRVIHLMRGLARPVQPTRLTKPDALSAGPAASVFQDERERKRREAASESRHTWNALFISANAVADAISARLNVDKASILIDKDSDDNSSAMSSNVMIAPSAAVNLALGEAKLVDETRRYLEENGVCLDAFASRPTQITAGGGLQTTAERSKTTLLVKNLPFPTRVDEIRALFAMHGPLVRVLLPPYGLTAIVEFASADDAALAFKRNAFTKFKNVPLYLEWAPKAALLPATDDMRQEAAVRDADLTASCTIYVKNLAFDTTRDALRKHFAAVARTVVSVEIAQQCGRSMGYGFVTLASATDVKKCLIELQKSSLDGHRLELRQSVSRARRDNVDRGRQQPSAVSDGAELDPDEENADNSERKTLLVRNVAFEATRRDVHALFTVYGELASVRLPAKPAAQPDQQIRQHRGFAFVEYARHSDARHALATLNNSVHLYGRRLVMEWAATNATTDLDVSRLTAEHAVIMNVPKKRGKRSVVSESGRKLASVIEADLLLQS